VLYDFLQNPAALIGKAADVVAGAASGLASGFTSLAGSFAA
jgi:hypothetical protein